MYIHTYHMHTYIRAYVYACTYACDIFTIVYIHSYLCSYNIHMFSTMLSTCSTNSGIDSIKLPNRVGILLTLTESVTLSEDPFKLFTIAAC